MKPGLTHSQPVQLPRVLGPWMATAIVIGTVIGSGVFKKASSVADKVPDFGMALAAWILVGLLTLLGALALAEVAILLPRAGGNYVFLKEGYGRWAGFLWGWVDFWIIRAGSIAALATVFSESVHDLLRLVRHTDLDVLTFWQRIAMTGVTIAIIAAINARGTRLGGGLQVIVTSVKVASLCAVALSPFVVLALVSGPQPRPSFALLEPVWPARFGEINWQLFGAALVGIFFAYHGWMNVTPVAEEVTNPHRNLPLSLVGGVFTIIALYVSVNFAYYLVIPGPEIAGLKDRTVVGEFAYRLFGPIGLALSAAAVMISVFGALNGNLLGGPRLLFAMGRDHLAPAFLAVLHPRYKTPARASAVLAGWSILLVIIVGFLVRYRLPLLEVGAFSIDLNLPAGKAPFDVVTDFAMFGALSFETLGVASLFIMRARYPRSRLDLPYRCPLYPWLPIAYVSAMAAILVNMFITNRSESLTGLSFIAVGAIVYFVFVPKRH